jgi:hypothetical protein
MYTKYPRTYHLPWSQSATSDDKTLQTDTQFESMTVVVTEKLDGENTTVYSNYSHARSIDSASHESRDWVKQLFTGFQHDIPVNWRLCGENVYAKHSIFYNNLTTYFYGFSIWNDSNQCLSWSDTLDWFALLGVTPVPVLYYGLYDRQKIRDIERKLDFSVTEGYVIRNAGSFGYEDFRLNIGKFVRQGHIQDTAKHWKQKQVVRNLISMS